MPAAGGAPAQITRQGGIAAIESGDGFLYYAKDAASPSFNLASSRQWRRRSSRRRRLEL